MTRKLVRVWWGERIFIAVALLGSASLVSTTRERRLLSGFSARERSELVVGGGDSVGARRRDGTSEDAKSDDRITTICTQIVTAPNRRATRSHLIACTRTEKAPRARLRSRARGTSTFYAATIFRRLNVRARAHEKENAQGFSRGRPRVCRA